MSETFIFAWHTAKRDRRVARLSLGMLTVVAGELAALTPQQPSAISARHSGALRMHWQNRPDFYTQPLVAAKNGEDRAKLLYIRRTNLAVSPHQRRSIETTPVLQIRAASNIHPTQNK